MPGTGPLPKPNSQRRRQNKESAFISLSGARKGPIPKLPKRDAGSWHPLTSKWWKALWTSPMATTYQEADFDTVVRLAFLKDIVNRTSGEKGLSGNSQLLPEIRQLEFALGVTPAARRKLHWEIKQAEAEIEPQRNNVRRLRAVDTKAS